MKKILLIPIAILCVSLSPTAYAQKNQSKEVSLKAISNLKSIAEKDEANGAMFDKYKASYVKKYENVSYVQRTMDGFDNYMTKAERAEFTKFKNNFEASLSSYKKFIADNASYTNEKNVDNVAFAKTRCKQIEEHLEWIKDELE